MVSSRGEQRAHELPAAHALSLEPSLVGADEAADVPQRLPRSPRLPEAEHLAQRAELVEVAAEKLDGRIVVRVEHARVGVEGLGEAGLDQLAAEELVLRVRNLAV